MSGLNEGIGMQLSLEIQGDRRREAAYFRAASEACARHPGVFSRFRCRLLVCLGRSLVHLGRWLESNALASKPGVENRQENVPGQAML